MERSVLFVLLTLLCLNFSWDAKKSRAFTSSNASGSKVHKRNYSKFKIEYKLKEISGLASSSSSATILFAIEDSGNGPVVNALTTEGKKVGRILLKRAHNRDWEDIATGPGTEKGAKYVYVADIGDNFHIRSHISIYRFKEPLAKELSEGKDLVIEAEQIKLKYPGKRFDAEAILIDPATAAIYVLTKQASGCTIYRAAQPSGSGTQLMKQVSYLPIGTVTAACMSKKRDLLILKNLDNVFAWRIKGNQNLEKVLQQKPEMLSYEKEEQGEAICFDALGLGYFTTSELRKNGHPELRFYSLPN